MAGSAEESHASMGCIAIAASPVLVAFLLYILLGEFPSEYFGFVFFSIPISILAGLKYYHSCKARLLAQKTEEDRAIREVIEHSKSTKQDAKVDFQCRVNYYDTTEYYADLRNETPVLMALTSDRIYLLERGNHAMTRLVVPFDAIVRVERLVKPRRGLDEFVAVTLSGWTARSNDEYLYVKFEDPSGLMRAFALGNFSDGAFYKTQSLITHRMSR